MNNTGLFPLSRALSLLLLAAAIITGDAQAAEQPPASFTDNVAVIRLLKRMDILPMVRSKLAHPPEADANLQTVMLYMSSRASDVEQNKPGAPLQRQTGSGKQGNASSARAALGRWSFYNVKLPH
jgi:hypothetical protein